MRVFFYNQKLVFHLWRPICPGILLTSCVNQCGTPRVLSLVPWSLSLLLTPATRVLFPRPHLIHQMWPGVPKDALFSTTRMVHRSQKGTLFTAMGLLSGTELGNGQTEEGNTLSSWGTLVMCPGSSAPVPSPRLSEPGCLAALRLSHCTSMLIISSTVSDQLSLEPPPLPGFEV